MNLLPTTAPFSKTLIYGVVCLGLLTTGCATPATNYSNKNVNNKQRTYNINNNLKHYKNKNSTNLNKQAVHTSKQKQHANKAKKYTANLNKTPIKGLPTPSVNISNVSLIPTVLIQKTRFNTFDKLDVSLLDDFINKISPNARHYPPNFRNVSAKYNAKEKLKEFEAWIRPFAEHPDASYDILLRAAKLNGMGRNLDLGSDYAIRASTYVAKAIKKQPNSAEANFLYGMMLSEGGGFKESKKYLNKAIALGYKEAEQSLAQADLLSDKRGAALSRLQRLQKQNPNNKTIAQQIALVQSGKYYIWDLPTD